MLPRRARQCCLPKGSKGFDGKWNVCELSRSNPGPRSKSIPIERRPISMSLGLRSPLMSSSHRHFMIRPSFIFGLLDKFVSCFESVGFRHQCWLTDCFIEAGKKSAASWVRCQRTEYPVSKRVSAGHTPDIPATHRDSWPVTGRLHLNRLASVHGKRIPGFTRIGGLGAGRVGGKRCGAHRSAARSCAA